MYVYFAFTVKTKHYFRELKFYNKNIVNVVNVVNGFIPLPSTAEDLTDIRQKLTICTQYIHIVMFGRE